MKWWGKDERIVGKRVRGGGEGNVCPMTQEQTLELLKMTTQYSSLSFYTMFSSFWVKNIFSMHVLFVFWYSVFCTLHSTSKYPEIPSHTVLYSIRKGTNLSLSVFTDLLANKYILHLGRSLYFVSSSHPLTNIHRLLTHHAM
jgi:hypothetical protein